MDQGDDCRHDASGENDHQPGAKSLVLQTCEESEGCHDENEVGDDVRYV